MFYEIINPSDEYHFEAPDLEIAAVCLAVLGEGKYGGRPDEEGGTSIPIFMFGNDPDVWFKKQFNKTFEETLHDVLNTRKNELADAFESVTIGTLADQKMLADAMKEIPDQKGRNAYKKKWINKRRTSMNDIGKRAKSLADFTRKK